MKDLAGKVAFISGGATGLGLGITRAFLEAGMNVVMSYRRPESLDEAMNSFSAEQCARVRAVQLDVTDREAMAHVAGLIEEAFGKIHVLCNNVGAIMFCPLDQASYDDWEWIMNTNFYSVFHSLKHIVPRIKAHGEGGHIVNTASMSAFISGPSVGLYTASKCALRGFTECLRYDLAPHRIGVSLLCPGLVKSSIHESIHRRPPYTSTGATTNTVFETYLRGTFALGMDPLTVGRHVVDGVRANRPYIFSHPDFGAEVRGIFEEIVAAMPPDDLHSPRAALEEARRNRTAAARKRADVIL